MNTTLKRGLQILGTVAILGISACVVDPYYSGVDYGGYDAYNYDNSYTSTTRVIGNGSNFALSTGFLVGNYYYYDDYYYPINYYTSGGTRYYRPIFDRPYRVHPESPQSYQAPFQIWSNFEKTSRTWRSGRFHTIITARRTRSTSCDPCPCART